MQVFLYEVTPLKKPLLVEILLNLVFSSFFFYPLLCASSPGQKEIGENDSALKGLEMATYDKERAKLGSWIRIALWIVILACLSLPRYSVQ